jgi:hypothetical protein
MQFVEAFNALGFSLANQRQDWSAENESGICISLWTKETDWTALVMDTRIHAGDLAIWKHKPGNAKRAKHARRALEEFGGWVDVVKIDGVPGESYGHATPWNPEERKGFQWKVTYLDDETGHLRLEASPR